MAKLIEPAIGYAEDGFAVSEQLGNGFKILNDKLAQFPYSREIFTRDGSPIQPGETLVQKNLAKTLKKVASGGAEAFYTGDVAQ